MKIENHLEAYKEHRETIFDWALKVKGLKNSQRIIGLHASRGIVDLLMVHLLKKGAIDSGTMINHRWFKSKSVLERLPEFENKEAICDEIIKLELLCEDLTYGAPKPEDKIKEAILLFNKLEEKLKDGEK
ncbi:MAG: hypothetical protein Q7S74_03020 [Nanoarchaeota archaeon]|nr:hypothetical protein [Nanoarchaeota archaeon]